MIFFGPTSSADYFASSDESEAAIIKQEIHAENIKETAQARINSFVSRSIFVIGFGAVSFSLGVSANLSFIWILGTLALQLLDIGFAKSLVSNPLDRNLRIWFVAAIFASCVAYAMIVPIGWVEGNQALRLLIVIFVAGALTSNALRTQRVPVLGWIASIPYIFAVAAIIYIEILISQNFNLFESVALIATVLLGFSYVLSALKYASTTSAQLSELITQNRLRELKAHKANHAKSEFLAVMSHEMRTPMNAILGSATLLSDAKIGPKEKELVQVLESSGKGLMSLLNDLLDLSKIESGKMVLENNAFSIRNLANEIYSLWQGPCQTKGIELRLSVSDNVSEYLKGDSNRIQQILNNLLSNAVKFTQNGGKIELLVYLKEQQICFEVNDTGAGISQDAKMRIFEPYEQAQAETSRLYGGTGLGLATSKKLANLMNGDIILESELGKGSRFLVLIEMIIADKSEVTERSNLKDHATPIIEEQIKILIADDNESNRLILKRFIEPMDCLIFEARDGLEALQLAHEQIFDIVLLDVRMPNMDGLEACQKIRLLENENKNVPIVLVSADAAKEQTETGLLAGADSYLTKPIDISKLYSTIDEALSKRAIN